MTCTGIAAHWPRFRRLALGIVLLAAMAAQAAWGPVLGVVTPTSAQIAWRATDADAGSVRFGGQVYSGTATESYRLVTLAGLTPDTEYPYEFLQGDTATAYRFRTAPEAATDFTFAVYGDTRSGHDVHRQLITAITELRPRLLINSGDLVGNGLNENDWTTFFSLATSLTATLPYVAAPGNHEVNASYFYRLFPTPPGGGELGKEWYALDYGMLRVIVLNSTRKREEQRDWLEDYLIKHGAEPRWTVVVFHHPLFSSGDRGGDAQLRELWLPVLQKHHVDAVFHGHDHFYERSVVDGIPFIITGGGGAPKYPVDRKPNPYRQVSEVVAHWLRVDLTATTLRIRMIRQDGTVGDDTTLTKPLPAAKPAPATL